MKFLNLGLVAISSLFATSLAAPALPGLPTDVTDVAKVPVVHVPVVPETDAPVKRTEVVYTKIQYTIVEVKKHCSTINSTVDGVTKGQIAQKKADIIKLVKSEVTIIISLIHSLVGDIVECLGETVEIVGEEKEKIISCVLELIFDIIFCLKHVIKVLGCSKFTKQSTTRQSDSH
ncbi:hypothetical protein CCUS01_03440 [Colletotrichum cuscutae]|uniref:Uncharacterized protein n=1 Tax=Colletotrichum cuscutae TaxID=1209917 RepID=A0AAI9Y8H3_9PEZI|nr:hypothetical protein CCUS01_03440 [Colletotrichum cuscutae]